MTEELKEVLQSNNELNDKCSEQNKEIQTLKELLEEREKNIE